MITLLYKEIIDDSEVISSNDTNDSLVYLNYFITRGNSSIDDYKAFFHLSEVNENTVKPNPENKNASTIFYNNNLRSFILTDIKQVIFFFFFFFFYLFI